MTSVRNIRDMDMSQAITGGLIAIAIVSWIILCSLFILKILSVITFKKKKIRRVTIKLGKLAQFGVIFRRFDVSVTLAKT